MTRDDPKLVTSSRASSAKALSRSYPFFRQLVRGYPRQLLFSQLFTWPADQPRHATYRSTARSNPIRPRQENGGWELFPSVCISALSAENWSPTADRRKSPRQRQAHHLHSIAKVWGFEGALATRQVGECPRLGGRTGDSGPGIRQDQVASVERLGMPGLRSPRTGVACARQQGRVLQILIGVWNPNARG